MYYIYCELLDTVKLPITITFKHDTQLPKNSDEDYQKKFLSVLTCEKS